MKPQELGLEQRIGCVLIILIERLADLAANQQ